MERSMNELLVLTQSKITKLFYYNSCRGICGVVLSLWANRHLSNAEYDMLLEYIENNKPDGCVTSYYFPPGELQPRLDYLEKHIKLTDK